MPPLRQLGLQLKRARGSHMATRSRRERSAAGFTLHVPLDASSIADRGEQAIRVVLQLEEGRLQSEVVRLTKSAAKATATFKLDRRPSAVSVLVGPESATDEELTGLQTIRADVSPLQLKAGQEVRLEPIQISPYYWYWWLEWCRWFVIRGRVVCPDGNPVPGATVCAFDSDWWWWWWSRQKVGCATTDINGVFEIQFRWCCGWWPWWWWRYREWRLEPILYERISPLIEGKLRPGGPIPPDPAPDVRIFERLAPQTAIALRSEQEASVTPHPMLEAISSGRLEKVRNQLAETLPPIELGQLRLWPWWPWWPWWDCSPDITFQVTQPCQGRDAVIVNEGLWQTRWDIPTTLNVTLVANEQACCVPPHSGCTDGNCLVLTEACDDLVTTIGGNPAAIPTPAGFENPGLISIYGDRPYAGVVPISGTAECMTGVDYYDFQWSNDNGVTWHDVPPGSDGTVYKTYVQFAPLAFPTIAFPATPISGRNVYETLSHYEANNPPADWGMNRVWIGNERDVLMNWQTDALSWPDGTYRLRVRGWNLVAGNLVNPRILTHCSSNEENHIVITLDNRLVGPGSGHPPSVATHICGGTSVHLCTLEPDTNIFGVTIVHPNAGETPVGPCGVTKINQTDILRVDFFVYDPDAHLAYYTLVSKYGLNLEVDVLAQPGLTLAPYPGVAPVPSAVQVGPDYAAARLAGAVAPIWRGGAIRLEVPAHLVFPETCCYQLELYGHKRTIVSCDDSLWGQTNVTEYSFMVEV